MENQRSEPESLHELRRMVGDESLPSSHRDWCAKVLGEYSDMRRELGRLKALHESWTGKLQEANRKEAEAQQIRLTADAIKTNVNRQARVHWRRAQHAESLLSQALSGAPGWHRAATDYFTELQANPVLDPEKP